MERLAKWLFSPLVFGLAFLAPLSAQMITTLGISTPANPIVVGLLIGGGLGLMAQIRGSWLWIKP